MSGVIVERVLELVAHLAGCVYLFISYLGIQVS